MLWRYSKTSKERLDRQLILSTNFAPLFWTQFFGAFNDNLFRFSLVILIVFQSSNQSDVNLGTLVASTAGVFILPFFLFSALAGQLADRYENSLLIKRLKEGEIAIMILGLIAFHLSEFSLLIVTLFVMGTQSTFFGPIKYSILPQLLSGKELTSGNAFVQAGTYFAILMGSTLGGILASLDPSSPTISGVAMVFVAVLGRLAAGFIPKTSVAQPDLRIDLNPISASFDILRQTAAKRGILSLIILISFFWFSGTIYFSIAPAYGRTLLQADQWAVVLLNAALTIGIGLGGLVISKVSMSDIRPIKLVPYASILMALAAASVWLLAPPEYPTGSLTVSEFFSEKSAGLFFFQLLSLGVSGSLFVIPLYTELQKSTLATHKARNFAALNIFNSVFIVAATGFISLLYQLELELTQMFAVVAAGALGVSALANRFVSTATKSIPTCCARAIQK